MNGRDSVAGQIFVTVLESCEREQRSDESAGNLDCPLVLE